MAVLQSQFVRARYDLTTSARLAFDSVRAHKLRSFLTLLGVIIGVASVIMVGAAIEGLGVYAEQSTSKVLGSDSYLIAQIAAAGRMSRKDLFAKLRRNKQLNMTDLEYLRQVNGANTYYSAYRQSSTEVQREGAKLEDVSIIGVNAVMAQIRDVAVADGRFFTEQEERMRQPVVVIGDELRTVLFADGSSPVGRTVKFKGYEFLIVGVQEKLGSAFGRSQDRSAYIPVTVFQRIFNAARTVTIYGRPRPDTGMKLDEAVDLTRAALRSRFHTRIGQEDNFDTLTPDAVRGFIDNILALVAAVVVPVTCISLLVGGIVIMNIMLVSVTERTREIGIRKAMGARRADIMRQVLIEAVLMASLGGLLGVVLGAVVTEGLSRIFEINMRITATYVLLAVGVSTAVGLASGWYPAARAARLDPIVALRSE